MLGEPKFGWTHITCGTVNVGPASYIEDVPMDCLNAFIRYFTDDASAFNLCFDAEGYNIGIIEFGQSLYKVSTDVAEGLNVKEIDGSAVGLDWYASSDEILMVLAKELIHDIRAYMDTWVSHWISDDLSAREKLDRRQTFIDKCMELESLIS